MTSQYIPSSNISMYPSSLRDDNADRNAKLNSEQNIISIINRLTDMDSFIISGLEYDGSNITAGECNIGGYYFNIKQSISFTTANDNVYFVIVPSTSDNFTQLSPIGDYTSLDTNKADGTFTGLVIVDDLNNIPSDNKISLLIATKEDNNWTTPKESKLRFTTSIIKYKANSDLTTDLNNLVIDDGTL